MGSSSKCRDGARVLSHSIITVFLQFDSSLARFSSASFPQEQESVSFSG